MNKLNLIGKTFNRLYVLSESQVVKGKSFWDCKCICGNKITVLGSALTTGQTQSCGCLQKERVRESRFKHGISNHSTEYMTWSNIKTRCYNTKVNEKHYLSKGIQVCDRWMDKRNGFINFISDMGKKPTPFHSIERKNSKGNYEPSNCKWATNEEQTRNKGNNIWFEYAGMRMILQDWANYFGVDQANLIVSLKTKSIEQVYLYYKNKYNGVFPKGKRKIKIKTENYNTPESLIAFKDGMSIVVESKSIREMSRKTNIHHSIIKQSISNCHPYKDWTFQRL